MLNAEYSLSQENDDMISEINSIISRNYTIRNDNTKEQEKNTFAEIQSKINN